MTDMPVFDIHPLLEVKYVILVEIGIHGAAAVTYHVGRERAVELVKVELEVRSNVVRFLA